LAPLEYIE